VPRRIELPSAAALFGEVNGGQPLAAGSDPAAAAAATTKPKRAKKSMAGKSAAKKAVTKKAVARKTAADAVTTAVASATRARKRATPALRRIDRLAVKLDALPIDALLELHDDIEGILAAPTIDVVRLNSLLDAVGA
jgi:hypothetical protein